MINTLSRILLTGSVLALTACGGGGGDAGGGDTGGDTGSGGETPQSSITLKTATGGTVDLNTSELAGSITTECYTNNSNGRIDSLSMSGLIWTYKEHTYAGDTSCSSTPATATATATLTIGNDSIIQSWIDGNNGANLNPPLAAINDGTTVPTTPAYTIINGIITNSDITGVTTGYQFSSGYVIDDSSSDGVVLYRVQNTTTNEATIEDPFTNLPNLPVAALGPNLEINITSVKNTNDSTTEIAYTIENTGDTATSTSFHVMGWADRATAPVYGVASSNNFGRGPSGDLGHGIIAAGGSENGTVTVHNTNVTPGDNLNAYLIADIFENIGESNEGVTGVNDNLSHRPWTVGNIFSYEGQDYTDIDSTITINAHYDSSSDKTVLRFSESTNAYSRIFMIRLNGEITTGIYDVTDFISAGTIIRTDCGDSATIRNSTGSYYGGAVYDEGG